jgi:MoaA/NifB/PqqE/SkfB family radical SAM enzyme
MPNFDTLEPAFIPNEKPTFLLDWEITLRCNLDCSYCGPFAHNNSTNHPSLEECLKTIDFMFDYVDLYMKKKVNWSREVILNVYGGESLFHPDILEIHKRVKEKHKSYNWPLTVTTTTNLIAGPKLLKTIIPHIDEFTCSYHTESSDKQKQIFRNNLLTLKQENKRFKVIVLLHPKKENWDDAISIIDFCKNNNIKFLPRQLDHEPEDTRFNYNQDQLEWFQQFYNMKAYKNQVDIKDAKDGDLAQTGRACCGGRKVCLNQNYKKRNFFVPGNNFKGWNCSVNWFFLYIKQLTGDIYVNKDCRMKFDGTVGPIGNIKEADILLNYTKEHLANNAMPIIKCAKQTCFCGLCAPKAKTIEKFDEIFKKYISSSST